MARSVSAAGILSLPLLLPSPFHFLQWRRISARSADFGRPWLSVDTKANLRGAFPATRSGLDCRSAILPRAARPSSQDVHRQSVYFEMRHGTVLVVERRYLSEREREGGSAEMGSSPRMSLRWAPVLEPGRFPNPESARDAYCNMASCIEKRGYKRAEREPLETADLSNPAQKTK